jgi:hypothetical protein
MSSSPRFVTNSSRSSWCNFHSSSKLLRLATRQHSSASNKISQKLSSVRIVECLLPRYSASKATAVKISPFSWVFTTSNTATLSRLANVYQTNQKSKITSKLGNIPDFRTFGTQTRTKYSAHIANVYCGTVLKSFWEIRQKKCNVRTAYMADRLECKMSPGRMRHICRTFW